MGGVQLLEAITVIFNIVSERGAVVCRKYRYLEVYPALSIT